jgi:hypothetical protein
VTARAGGNIYGGGGGGGGEGGSGGRILKTLVDDYNPDRTQSAYENLKQRSATNSQIFSFMQILSDTENANVYSAHNGTVIGSSYLGANDGYLLAILDDSGLFSSVYTGLQESERAQIGDRIFRGQKIGKLGGGVLIPPNVLRIYIRDVEKKEFVDPKKYLQEFFPDENFDSFDMGGFVLNKNKTSSVLNTKTVTYNPQTMTIKIPIASTNPRLFARDFAELMRSNI